MVTGIGLVTPLAVGTEETWRALLQGRSGIGPITQFDAGQIESRIAGEVSDFQPTRWIRERDLKTVDRFIQLAVAASCLAVQDAGLPEGVPLGEPAGCYLGVAIGGAPIIERTVLAVAARGPRFGVSPLFIPSVLPNLAASAVALRFGILGPVLCHATACAAGGHAVGEALRAIQHGEADVMLAGGAESPLNLVSVAGFASLRALSRCNDSPERASRPFDLERDGFVIAEGAGVMVLEEEGHARRRDAKIYAELRGYGLTSDATHPTAPPPDGAGAARAMRRAMRDAGVGPEEVSYVNAHGTGTRLNDAAETQAIKSAFGDAARSTMVSSSKSMTGHMMGAAGAVEAAICALACARDEIPPTINLHTLDPACDLDYVPNEARREPVRLAMSNSLGFGGVNASLVFGKRD